METRSRKTNTINVDDKILIDRARNGDIAAFDCLMRRHYPKASRFALKLTMDSDVASDIVAEAFGRAFRSIARFRHGSSFTTWLYRIQKNCFLDHKNKKRIEALSFTDVLYDSVTGEEVLQVLDESPTPVARAESTIRREKVQRSMKRLTPTQRQILKLAFNGEKSYAEMSRELVLPIGTIKSRMNRAKLCLGKLFYSEGDPLILEYFG
jgi:RNA polymerase sigma-70 factor (ECF subfamily)